MAISIPEQYQSLKTKLETIVKKVVSPQEIPANSDLNDYTEAGFYYCKLPNTGLATLSNAPDDVTTGGNGFSLLVENTNVYGNGVKQTLTTFAKSSTFVRNFWTDHDEVYHTTGWQPVYEDTGWQDVSLSSGFTHYDSNAHCRYRRVGKVVELRGAIKNSSAILGTTVDSSSTIATISDTTCRPSSALQFVQQGSGMNRFLLQVSNNGGLTIGRYGTTSPIQMGAGSWINLYATWIVD